MINSLVGILLRFKLHPIAFVSDIEKAFLNIQLAETDRKYTKFLWLSDPLDPDGTLKTYRFKSVLFGSVSSPFMLHAVVKTHLDKYPSPVTVDLQNNIHVDNVISGTETEEDAVSYYRESIELLHEAGFKLRCWSTNCNTLQAIANDDNNYDSSTSVKVLGMTWQPTADVLTYPPMHTNSAIATKREVVKHASSFFDPLGISSPVHVKAKIFIQNLWTMNLHWDEQLNETLVTEWNEICTDMDKTRSTAIKPWYLSTDKQSTEYELHVFADASMKAYGAVAYLKCENETSFIISKSRVKPLKDITLPRLELLAAVIATQLAQLVNKSLNQLNIKKITLWSDSQIVLHWINSQKKLPQFVQNRVTTIKNGPFTDMKYCPTEDNPADQLTRGLTYTEFSQSSLWSNGPTWLQNSDWPICDMFDRAVLACQTDNDVDNHAKCNTPLTQTDKTQTSNTVSQHHDSSLAEIIDVSRFSNLTKLLRVTCIVLRFINLLKRGSKQTKHTGYITVPEMNTSRHLWIKDIQQRHYPKENMMLQKTFPHTVVKNSLHHQLKLFLDDSGIIRCGGRLQNADIDFNAKHPVLLPPNHHFTSLLVKQAHTHLLHAGPGTTLTQIRQTYWIPRLRRVVKHVIKLCVTCQKVNAMPYSLPETPPLQQCRLAEAPPFTVCGVDFTGAIYYQSPLSTGPNKAYICLFTCAVTRAIHLEIVIAMTVDSFLRAFRRFAGRRSLPQQMISDNGSTFFSGAEEIKQIMENNRYLTSRNVQWKFIPKRAPWYGGFYERLIGTTKTVLKKILGRALVTLDKLNTIIVEIEAQINERPLTYVSPDINDPKPLSPSMLLYGHSLTVLPHQHLSEDELNDPDYTQMEDHLNKRIRRLDLLIKQCCDRRKSDYLSALREAHQA
jgi:ribonuclease HI